MKKGILMLAAIAAVAFTSCKENAADKVQAENVEEAANRDAKANEFPVMTFEETTHDFGDINQGEVVNHTFSFTNTGDAPLVITDAKATCGCTVPKWPKGESIAPGETGEMTVRYDSRGKKGIQNKSVRITANTEKGTETLRIKVNVIAPQTTAGAPVQ